MAETSHEPGTLLAQRLDQLFRTVHPKDRGPYSNEDVAEAINSAAGESVISATYIWALRTGRSTNPTLKRLRALAAFFGVPPVYFLDDAEVGLEVGQAELIPYLKDDRLRGLVLRAAGLSDRSLRAISEIVENARTVEGVPELDPRP